MTFRRECMAGKRHAFPIQSLQNCFIAGFESIYELR